MDWFSILEQKRRFALFSVMLIVLATLAVTAMRDPRTYDGFWHLKMGEDLVENHLSPWQDHYSFTFEGAEVNSPPVAFEVLLFRFVEQFGVGGGFKLFKFFAMTLVLVMMLWWLRHIKAPVLVYGLVLPLLVTMLQFRATVRPELISYAFEILAIILYDRARNRMCVSTMLPIVVLMWAWSNYHSAVFGYIIFVGLFLDLGWAQLRQKAGLKTWASWLSWGAITVAVGFANPSLSHPLIEALLFPAEWKTLIQEYLSPAMYSNVPSIYVLALVSMVTLWLCWRQKLYGFLFVCGVFLANASTTARLVAPAGIVILCVFAFAMSKLDYKALMAPTNVAATRSLAIFALIVMLVPLLHNVIVARAFIAQNQVRGYYPDGMVNYMKDSGLQGRILNSYEIGGYLIYNLAPQSRVYIDGRTNILYPVAHYRKYLDAFASAEQLKAEIKHHDIQFVVAKNSDEHAVLMDQTGILQLEYADINYLLYRRGQANLPIAGKLWARPYCWRESDSDALLEERAFAAIQLIPDSPLRPFLNLLTDYAVAESAIDFLKNQKDINYWPDASKRFAGFQAIKLGDYEFASDLFAGIKDRRPKDFLAYALINLRKGDPVEAEMTLAQALEKGWPMLEFIDLVIMHALLEEIREVHPWTTLDDSYVDNLVSEIEGAGIPGPGPRVKVETFCADPP